MYNENSPSWERDNKPYDRSAPNDPSDQEFSGKARIKVIGVGGAGNNAVNRLIEAGITSAEYVAVNTDAQILACSKADHKIQIGAQRTKGLGAGADPEIGRIAAEEDKEKLLREIENTDLLFITAGMGGGTGTGAAPVIAKIAKDLKILTVAVVTEPFKFEGKQRKDNSMRGLDNLRKYVDALIIIPNEKIKDIVPKGTPIDEAFRVADDVLRQGIRGIADLIVTPALINLDFADVRAILKDRGLAYMGVGVAKGDNRIYEAVRLAVNSPLLQTTIEGATGVILNIVGGKDLSFDEADSAATLIHGVVDYTANIIVGACIDENIHDEVEVTVIATGFPSASMRENMKNNAGAQNRPSPSSRMAAYNPAQPRERDAVQLPRLPQNPYSAQQRPANGYPPAANPPYGAQPQRPMPPQGYPQQAQTNSFAPQPQPQAQTPYGAQPPARNVTTVPPYGAQPQRPMPPQAQNPYAQQPQQPQAAQPPQGYPQPQAQANPFAGQPQPQAQNPYAQQPQQPQAAQPPQGYPQQAQANPFAPQPQPQTQNPYAQQPQQPQAAQPPQGYPQPQAQANPFAPQPQPQAQNPYAQQPQNPYAQQAQAGYSRAQAPARPLDDEAIDDLDEGDEDVQGGTKNIPEFVRRILKKKNP